MNIVGPNNWAAQTPGGTLTAGVAATIPLAPVPIGFATSNYYLYVQGGTGAPEAVLVTGGTGVSGAATGTATFTPANNHSGLFTVTSATAGIQEALNANVSGTIIKLPPLSTIFAPIFVGSDDSQISGASTGFVSGSVISAQTPGQSAFILQNANGCTLQDFCITYPSSQTSGRAIQLGTAAVGAYNTLIRRVNFNFCYDAIYMYDSSSDLIDHCSFFDTRNDCIRVFSSVADATGPIISNNFTGQESVPGRSFINHVQSGALHIVSNSCHQQSQYGYYGAMTGVSSQVQITSNQFDGQTVAGIYIAPSATFNAFTIVGNAISNFTSSTYTGIWVNSPTAMSGVITGNRIEPYFTTAPAGIKGIVCDGTDWLIANNLIHQANVGITVNTGTNVQLGINNFVAINSNYGGTAGSVLISQNAHLPPAIGTSFAYSGVNTWFVGADGAPCRIVLDSYAQPPVVAFRMAGGTAAAPTAVQSGNLLGGLSCYGRGATTYGPLNSGITMIAAENWTDTAQGSFLTLQVTPKGATSVRDWVTLDSQGNFVIATGYLARGATDGFLYIPVMQGTPTGVPTNYLSTNGAVPMVYDNVTHKLWIYDAGWKGVVVS